jgi:hypothetical protein
MKRCNVRFPFHRWEVKTKARKRRKIKRKIKNKKF